MQERVDAINEIYEDPQSEYGVELIAISTDDARTAPKIKPTITQKRLKYTFLNDQNQNCRKHSIFRQFPHFPDRQGW
ncbi:MAG: hypothetical protein IPI42_06740 [Saprospiraceae bacterium]|nr:hypothetical protein [Candidatus Parvibacillus calidus]